MRLNAGDTLERMLLVIHIVYRNKMYISILPTPLLE